MTNSQPTSDEREERLKQIRGRNKTRRDLLSIRGSYDLQTGVWDIDFLLSLLDSQSATLRELAMIVDVGTNDDPGTALSKLHKIQHVAATAMRDKCVEKLDSMARHGTNELVCAALSIAARSLESLTLDQPEKPEKQ